VGYHPLSAKLIIGWIRFVDAVGCPGAGEPHIRQIVNLSKSLGVSDPSSTGPRGYLFLIAGWCTRLTSLCDPHDPRRSVKLARERVADTSVIAVCDEEGALA
jgi:hypothetical protein